jgi:hypothetical protein
MLTVKLDPYLKYLDMLSFNDNGFIIKDGTKLVIPEGMRTRWIDYLQNLRSSTRVNEATQKC